MARRRVACKLGDQPVLDVLPSSASLRHGEERARELGGVLVAGYARHEGGMRTVWLIVKPCK